MRLFSSLCLVQDSACELALLPPCELVLLPICALTLLPVFGLAGMYIAVPASEFGLLRVAKCGWISIVSLVNVSSSTLSMLLNKPSGPSSFRTITFFPLAPADDVRGFLCLLTELYVVEPIELLPLLSVLPFDGFLLLALLLIFRPASMK